MSTLTNHVTNLQELSRFNFVEVSHLSALVEVDLSLFCYGVTHDEEIVSILEIMFSINGSNLCTPLHCSC